MQHYGPIISGEFSTGKSSKSLRPFSTTCAFSVTNCAKSHRGGSGGVHSVVAQLLGRRRRRSEGVTVVTTDVSTDSAALTPPLVAVSCQAGGAENNPPMLKFYTDGWSGTESADFTSPGCSEAWRSTPGRRRCRNAGGCQRNKPGRKRRDQEDQSCSAETKNRGAWHQRFLTSEVVPTNKCGPKNSSELRRSAA